MGDPQLLRQLVANLVDNALKFTERGGVFVRAGTSGETAWIEVADTGPGIPEDELPLVFDRFYGRTNRVRASRGTGLWPSCARSRACTASRRGDAPPRRRPRCSERLFRHCSVRSRIPHDAGSAALD